MFDTHLKDKHELLLGVSPDAGAGKTRMTKRAFTRLGGYVGGIGGIELLHIEAQPPAGIPWVALGKFLDGCGLKVLSATILAVL